MPLFADDIDIEQISIYEQILTASDLTKTIGYSTQISNQVASIIYTSNLVGKSFIETYTYNANGLVTKIDRDIFTGVVPIQPPVQPSLIAFPRINVSFTTSILNPNSTSNIELSLGQKHLLFEVGTTVPAWVKLYKSMQLAIVDAGRPVTQDPNNNAGVVVEVVTTNDNLNVLLSSPIYSDNLSNTRYCVAVTNFSFVIAPITTTFNLIKLED